MKRTRRKFLKEAGATGLMAALAASLEGMLGCEVFGAGVPKSGVDVYMDAFLAQLDGAMKANAPAIAASARASADAIFAGGRLKVWGDSRTLTGESIGRASGVRFNTWGDKVRPSVGKPWRDTLLLFNETRNSKRMTALAEKTREKGGLVIGFEVGGRPRGRSGPFVAACDYGIYNYGTTGEIAVGGGKSAVPTTGALNMTLLWVWTTELAGVMAERGKPISMWKSLHYKDAAVINDAQQALYKERGF